MEPPVVVMPPIDLLLPTRAYCQVSFLPLSSPPSPKTVYLPQLHFSLAASQRPQLHFHEGPDIGTNLMALLTDCLQVGSMGYV
jgi:hypothetical protein